MESNEERLKEIVDSPERFAYLEDEPDNEYPKIKWSVFGSFETSEIIVKVEVGNLSYYASEISRVSFPVMRDRIFGIDVLDQALSRELTNRLWEKHGPELVQRATEEKR
jgi:hypothetical protein